MASATTVPAAKAASLVPVRAVRSKVAQLKTEAQSQNGSAMARGPAPTVRAASARASTAHALTSHVTKVRAPNGSTAIAIMAIARHVHIPKDAVRALSGSATAMLHVATDTVMKARATMDLVRTLRAPMVHAVNARITASPVTATGSIVVAGSLPAIAIGTARSRLSFWVSAVVASQPRKPKQLKFETNKKAGEQAPRPF